MIWNLTYPEKLFMCIHYHYKTSTLMVNLHYNVEHIYILQQINVNMCICIKGIKTTLLTFCNFSGSSMWLNLEMTALYTCSHSLSGTYHYSFSEESCSAGCLSVSVVNFSHSYTSSKAIVEPNSLCQDYATTKTWFCRERKSQYLSVYAYLHVSLCFICTSSHQMTIMLPLERNLLQVFITAIK
jgi:hypothetical protein